MTKHCEISGVSLDIFDDEYKHIGNITELRQKALEDQSCIDRLRAELLTYHRMASEGVWVSSLDYGQLVDSANSAKSQLQEMSAQLKVAVDALERIDTEDNGWAGLEASTTLTKLKL